MLKVGLLRDLELGTHVPLCARENHVDFEVKVDGPDLSHCLSVCTIVDSLCRAFLHSVLSRPFLDLLRRTRLLIPGVKSQTASDSRRCTKRKVGRYYSTYKNIEKKEENIPKSCLESSPGIVTGDNESSEHKSQVPPPPDEEDRFQSSKRCVVSFATITMANVRKLSKQSSGVSTNSLRHTCHSQLIEYYVLQSWGNDDLSSPGVGSGQLDNFTGITTSSRKFALHSLSLSGHHSQYSLVNSLQHIGERAQCIGNKDTPVSIPLALSIIETQSGVFNRLTIICTFPRNSRNQANRSTDEKFRG
ncbi:hypothetical protein J6590_085290 [Homalodisca vitripennis]|nr:hypothetical protein J6590_085290 [Homalodisca vitripennis]